MGAFVLIHVCKPLLNGHLPLQASVVRFDLELNLTAALTADASNHCPPSASACYPGNAGPRV